MYSIMDINIHLISYFFKFVMVIKFIFIHNIKKNECNVICFILQPYTTIKPESDIFCFINFVTKFVNIVYLYIIEYITIICFFVVFIIYEF